MRALFLQNNSKLQDGLYIFVAKGKILNAPFSQIEKDFLFTLKKSSTLKKENGS